MITGVRYVDIRAAWNSLSGEWLGHHYLYGPRLVDVFQNITQFLKDYPTEAAIIEISHIEGNPNDKEIDILYSLVLDSFGDLLYPVNTKFDFTIQE